MYRGLAVVVFVLSLAVPGCLAVPQEKNVEEDSVAISVKGDWKKFNRPYEGPVKELRYTKKN